MHERATEEAVAIQRRCQKRKLVGSTQQVIFGKGKGRMPLQVELYTRVDETSMVLTEQKSPTLGTG